VTFGNGGVEQTDNSIEAQLGIAQCRLQASWLQPISERITNVFTGRVSSGTENQGKIVSSAGTEEGKEKK
jgi:hypothetical protein